MQQIYRRKPCQSEISIKLFYYFFFVGIISTIFAWYEIITNYVFIQMFIIILILLHKTFGMEYTIFEICCKDIENSKKLPTAIVTFTPKAY